MAETNDDLCHKMESVFGNFEDFYNNISSQGFSVRRHGVAAYEPPTPPVASRRSGNPLHASPVQQATRDCLQKMQGLVSSPPLQSIPRLNKPYVNAESLNVSQGSSAGNSNNDFKSKKRKDRQVDADVDTENEKRRRRDRDIAEEEIRPGTSNSNNQNSNDDDKMRELFGDDNDEIEKATVSPDSGVHSTENDVGDDGDLYSAQTILNIITRLSPPLSPLPDRPLSRRKIEEEPENDDKEKAKLPFENDLPQIKLPPRLESIDSEKKKKEKELKEKSLKEIDKKRDKPKKEKESKEKILKESVDKKRDKSDKKENTRPPEKSEKNEKSRLEKADRLDKDKLPVPKPKSDKKLKEDEHKCEVKIEPEEPSLKLSGESRVRGELTLRALSSSKMNKLMDLGKKYGTLKNKDESLSPTLDSNEKRRKDKKDERDDLEKRKEKEKERKEYRNDKVADRPRERDIKTEANKPAGQSTPSPRPGSSQSLVKDFRCACNECMPTKPTKFEKNNGDAKPSEFYQTLAREKKRKADQEADRILRILLYLESTVYFGMSAQTMVVEDGSQRHISVLRDTSELLKVATHNFATKESFSPLERHFVSRIRNLSLRAQSVLSYHLYHVKSTQVLKSYQALEKMDCDIRIIPKTDSSNSESWNESPSSSSANVESAVISVNHYNCIKSQLKTLHYIMFAHKFWEDAALLTSKNPTDINFVNSLESVCGHYCMDTPLDKFGVFILTAANWIRAEYDLEKKRAPPSSSDRRS